MNIIGTMLVHNFPELGKNRGNISNQCSINKKWLSAPLTSHLRRYDNNWTLIIFTDAMFQCLMIYLDFGPPLPHELQIPQGFDLIYDNRYIMAGTLLLALTISETVASTAQIWNSLSSECSEQENFTSRFFSQKTKPDRSEGVFSLSISPWEKPYKESITSLSRTKAGVTLSWQG